MAASFLCKCSIIPSNDSASKKERKNVMSKISGPITTKMTGRDKLHCAECYFPAKGFVQQVPIFFLFFFSFSSENCLPRNLSESENLLGERGVLCTKMHRKSGQFKQIYV